MSSFTTTVREAVRWPLVDRAGELRFASLEPFIRAARRHRRTVCGRPPPMQPWRQVPA